MGKMKMRKGLLISPLIVLCLLATLMPCVSSASGTTVSIENATVGESETAVVQIMINDVEDAIAANIILNYNKNVVHVTDIGDSAFAIETHKNIDNTAGQAEYTVMQLGVPLSGDVRLAKVTLEAVGKVDDFCDLNITVVSLQNDIYKEIPRAVLDGTFTIKGNNPPMPTIVNPLEGDTLSGLVTIEEIDESGEEDIVYNLFEYYYDQNCNRKADDGNDWYKIGNDTDGSNGWSVNWYTTQYPDCCYMIRVTMGDELGQTGQDEINVALSNHDPVPAITSPQNGATLSGLVTIEEVDMSGEEDIVYNLFEYYYDENCNSEADDGNDWYEIGNDTDGSDGWSADWNTTQYPDGCYMIRATMGDNHGRTGTKEINVRIDNNPIIVTSTPIVTNASATPAVIPDDTDNDPRWGEIATLNVSVINQSSVSVTINLSAIGGSAVQPMTNIEGDIWSVTTNASDSGWNGTAYEPYLLQVNATNMEGKTNTSVSIELTVMKNGDVNVDGSVNLGDAIHLSNYALHVSGYEIPAELLVLADVDGNGDVNLGDGIYLSNYALHVSGYDVLH